MVEQPLCFPGDVTGGAGGGLGAGAGLGAAARARSAMDPCLRKRCTSARGLIGDPTFGVGVVPRLFSISNSKPGISSAWSINAANGANSAGGDGRCARAPGALSLRGTPPPPNGGECLPWKELRAPKKEDAPS